MSIKETAWNNKFDGTKGNGYQPLPSTDCYPFNKPKQQNPKDLTLFYIGQILNKPEFKNLSFEINKDGSCSFRRFGQIYATFKNLDEFVEYCLKYIARPIKSNAVEELKDLLR